jgi:hypothetical protein
MTNLQTRSLDPIGQSALDRGLAQATQPSPTEEITLQLDELTQHKLKRLANSMALSIKTIIETAINYTYADIKHSQTPPDQLPPIGDFPFKITLSLETQTKLEQIGMSHAVSECAIFGINLLYDRLIPQTATPHD